MKRIPSIALAGLFLLMADRVYPAPGGPLASIAQQAYLKASNTAMDDNFGYSVAISGDTVVIGANWEDSNATTVNGNQADNSASSAGAAYVFVREGTNWTQQAYLKASNAGMADQFGWSVAIWRDTIVVGANQEFSNATGVNGNQGNNGASFSGAAYVFVREGTNWSQQAYLKASNTDENDNFGQSVAVWGDTVVVGAFREASSATGVNGDQFDNNSEGSGAAYVFTRHGTNWSQQAYLKASNTRSSDQFGISVAVSGDTVVIGANGESSAATGVNGNQDDTSAFSSGAAYVFVRNGSNWSQQAYLKASNAGAIDFFGYSVAASDNTVVIGAFGESSNAAGVNGNQTNNSASFSGAAYVFVRNGTAWSQQAYLKSSNPDANDRFGWSVAISGNTILIGALWEASSATGVNGNQGDNSVSQSGAAYLFSRNGTNWSQQAYLKASNTDYFDSFGWAVATSDNTAAVGAYIEGSNATGVNGNQNDNSLTCAGAVYVFNVDPPPKLTTLRTMNNLRISWPFPATGFVLDQVNAINTLTVTGWAQVPFPYETNGTGISVTVPIAPTNQFYRLRK